MTSKERVLTAFHHQQPDRVPLGYNANPEIDQALLRHFGLKAGDIEGLLQRLGADFRGVGPGYVGPKLHADYGDRKVDDWGMRRRWVEHETGGYWDFCDWPLANATLEEVEAWPMPSPDHFDYAGIADKCRRLADKALIAGHAGIGDIINSSGMLRTMEQVLVDLVTDDPAGLRLIDRKLEIHLEMMDRWLAAGKGAFDILWMGEDLGTQIAPLISPETYRKHIRPRHQRFIDLARHHGVMVVFHCCGSSSWAFEDFIAMGVNVADTLQPEAANMSPAYLKAKFGGRLGFHGCISTAGPVAYGSVQDVIDNVRSTLAVMMPGGGYALAPTHSLQSNSPTENVLAMYEAAKKYGEY